MARISTYSIDTNVVAQDKWIGTDSNGSITKNFTAQRVADFLNTTSAVAIAGQNNFFFQTDLSNGRANGTISFTSGGGSNTAFASLTTIKISKYANSGYIVLDYLQTLVGQAVFVAQTDNVNNFGIYKLLTLTQDISEPNFYNATFQLIQSHGNLLQNNFYAFSVYPGFISYPFTVPTPTLQSVTDEGNTTTNEIIVNGSDFFSVINATNVGSQRISTGAYAALDIDGNLSLNNSNGALTTLRNSDVEPGNSGSEYQFPNKASGIYTLATIDDIPVITTPTLDEVLLSGNIVGSDTSIIYPDNGILSTSYENGSAVFNNTSSGDSTIFGWSGIRYQTPTPSIFTGIGFTTPSSNNAILFPDQSGTIALLSDIPLYVTPNLDSVLLEGNVGYAKDISLLREGDSLFSEGGILTLLDEIIGNIGNAFQASPFSAILSDNTGQLELTKEIITKGDGINSTSLIWDSLTSVETITIPNQSGTLALTSDIPSLSANSPITYSSGVISTSMNTNKLIGRSTAGTGVMEEITIGSGLTLTGGTLSSTSTSPLTTKGDIYTFSTVNARLGVGLDTQVLIADSTTATGLKWGTNTAATPTGYYAQYQDNNTQTVAVINTGYPIKFRTLDINNGVTVVSNSRITFANTGIYNLQFSVQLENSDTQEHDVTIWLRRNGVDVAGSSGFVAVVAKHGGINGHVLPSWNYLLDVIAGEYYELVWSATSTQVTMPFIAAGSPPPSTASAIFTVTQQAGIMAGTGMTSLTTAGSSGAATYNSGTGALNIPQYMGATTRKNANNSTNSNINYCGVAVGLGVSESSAVWTIKRLTIGTSGSITLATATNVAWTNRESVIYT